MRLKSAFTLLLTCVTISNALAVEEQEPETKQTVLAVCFETSLLARELIENTILADDIQNNTEKIALQLSEPLPPTYNGIIAGLNNAVASVGQQTLNRHQEHPQIYVQPSSVYGV